MTRSSKQLTLVPVLAKNKMSKQARAFHTSWLKDRKHWLVYKKGQGMFSSLCKKYSKRPLNRDTWNDKPCNRIRLDSILSHKNRAVHKDAVKLELAASASVNISGALNPPVPVIRMEQAFSCLYFFAKHRMAHTTNYEPLLDLMGLLGINIKDYCQKCNFYE